MAAPVFARALHLQALDPHWANGRWHFCFISHWANIRASTRQKINKDMPQTLNSANRLVTPLIDTTELLHPKSNRMRYFLANSYTHF